MSFWVPISTFLCSTPMIGIATKKNTSHSNSRSPVWYGCIVFLKIRNFDLRFWSFSAWPSCCPRSCGRWMLCATSFWSGTIALWLVSPFPVYLSCSLSPSRPFVSPFCGWMGPGSRDGGWVLCPLCFGLAFSPPPPGHPPLHILCSLRHNSHLAWRGVLWAGPTSVYSAGCLCGLCPTHPVMSLIFSALIALRQVQIPNRVFAQIAYVLPLFNFFSLRLKMLWDSVTQWTSPSRVTILNSDSNS